MTKKDILLRGMRYTASVAALCIAVNTHAYAQVESATTTADPSRVETQFQDGISVPNLGDKIEVESPILQEVPPNADEITFTLNSLQVEGVSAYQENDMRALYDDMLGETVSLADIYAISSALTNKYRNEGYILTQVIVPPQTIEGGNVRLRVIEGFVDRILVQGAEDDQSLALIREYASNVSKADALNVKDLERALLLIDDLPGVSARSILSPSRTTTGASDLRVIVERDHYESVLGVDNFGSRYLGPVQFTAGGALNSVLGYNEEITGQFVTATDIDEVELAYGALTYSQPINGLGTTANAFLSHSDTEPGYDLETFNVHGRSTHMGFGIEHPFVRSRTSNLTGRAGFDWRDVESKNDLEATRKDNIRAVRVGGTYEFLDTNFGVGINAVDLEISHGLDVLGASNDGDANLTRPAADPDSFTKAILEVQRLQRVTQDINLLMAARGQLANHALLSSEEFGVGGINFGRGYDPSEIIGEDGVATKFEVQWTQPVSWTVPEDYEVYGFYDFGKVWNDDATGSDDDESLASAGVGMRADFVNDIKGGVAVAFPLTRDVEVYDEKQPRFYFNLSRQF